MPKCVYLLFLFHILFFSLQGIQIIWFVAKKAWYGTEEMGIIANQGRSKDTFIRHWKESERHHLQIREEADGEEDGEKLRARVPSVYAMLMGEKEFG